MCETWANDMTFAVNLLIFLMHLHPIWIWSLFCWHAPHLSIARANDPYGRSGCSAIKLAHCQFVTIDARRQLFPAIAIRAMHLQLAYLF